MICGECRKYFNLYGDIMRIINQHDGFCAILVVSVDKTDECKCDKDRAALEEIRAGGKDHL